MSKEKILLILASVLILVGLFKPNFSELTSVISNPSTVAAVKVDAPENEELLNLAKQVTECFKSGSDDRKTEALRLAHLYHDMATLVSLDKEDVVIENTEAIRQANILAGSMLKLNIKDKYEGLSEAAENLVASAIGTDNVKLTDELREKSVRVFLALSWACLEGSK
tara:strand:+ start:2056 stop:2556 length:501 start_codon:yes stop_codon:yes gene_type:complete